MYPVGENTRSDETDVAGMPRYFRARELSRGSRFVALRQAKETETDTNYVALVMARWATLDLELG